MKFGHFDDAAREYVIETPKTPYPWINYLGNQGFFSLISNTAGGYSFYMDARLRRITRYRYNNVPLDMGGRYFYINDNGTVWNPGWSPVKTELDEYECRHGMGYTIIKGKKNGLKAEVTFFVPQNYDGEVQQVVLTNEGSEAKDFSIFSMAEWCLWDAQDDCTNFQRNFSTGRVEIEGSTIYHATAMIQTVTHSSEASTTAGTTLRQSRQARLQIPLPTAGHRSLHTTRRSLSLRARPRPSSISSVMPRTRRTRSSLLRSLRDSLQENSGFSTRRRLMP